MLPELEAERQMTAIEAASVPHMEDGSRTRVLNRLARILRRRGRNEYRSAAEALASLPIPVRRFPAKGVKKRGR